MLEELTLEIELTLEAELELTLEADDAELGLDTELDSLLGLEDEALLALETEDELEDDCELELELWLEDELELDWLELEEDDWLELEDELERSSIDRIRNRRLSAWLSLPGNIKLPVPKNRRSGRDSSPLVLTSIRVARQSWLSGRGTTALSVVAPTSVSYSAVGAESSPARIILVTVNVREASPTACPN